MKKIVIAGHMQMCLQDMRVLEEQMQLVAAVKMWKNPETLQFNVDLYTDDSNIASSSVVYNSVKKVGAGAFGEVYKVSDDERQFALKHYRARKKIDKSVLNFMQKIKDADTKNLIKYKAHGETIRTKRTVLVTNFIQGQNLEQYLEEKNRFNAQRVLAHFKKKKK